MYGYRRQYQTLIAEQFAIGIDKVRKYMKVLDLKAIYPKKNTSTQNKDHLLTSSVYREISLKKEKAWALHFWSELEEKFKH